MRQTDKGLRHGHLLVNVKESERAVIQCRYYGPGNVRGSRIRVGRMGEKDPNAIIVGWDDALSIGANYAAAVREYAARLHWGGVWHIGTFSGGAVAVWGGWAE